ncbi:hypothetical protein ACG-C40_0237a [Escherichia phage vB_EcoM_ACG-C40]|uniref:Uncharacterized protein n=1 Tax=Escherichia phage vB_EcoM_ACG-C40 TaxID=1141141 RepID=K4FC46_9CAUD|nr:hypothetical protein D862_gp276 [Escherichia phage vB_EcoM_ACG-C40]AFH20202.1 hypothetical protein ACG-C40_0237a [Escherichia phage vB_EcoM_ACG-C40]
MLAPYIMAAVMLVCLYLLIKAC